MLITADNDQDQDQDQDQNDDQDGEDEDILAIQHTGILWYCFIDKRAAMTIRYHNPWEEDAEHSALVALPGSDHSLYASCAGPRRQRGSPLLILFTGGGAPSASYVLVQHALSKIVRCLFYDRSGYGESTMADLRSISAEYCANELDILLQALQLQPPYLLVAHSYGGIVAREFLDLQMSKHNPSLSRGIISGMVMFDTPSELTWSVFPHGLTSDLMEISKDVDWNKIWHLRERLGLTDREWESMLKLTARTAVAARKEDNHGSAYTLAKKKHFESHRLRQGVLVVVRCNSTKTFQQMYDEGVKLGGGTEAQRKRARKFIEKWDLFNHELVKAQMDLVAEGGIGRYLYQPDRGHGECMTEPHLIAEPVRWALEQLKQLNKPTSASTGL